MDQDTNLAALMEQAERHTEEFRRLVPRLRALGDAHVSIPFELIEAICRPVSSFALPMPAFALRA